MRRRRCYRTTESGARIPADTPAGAIAAATAHGDDSRYETTYRTKGSVVSLLWWILFAAVAVVWVLSAVDIIRRRYSGWTTAGWLGLIVILPFVGSLIYWAMRKPTRAEVEQSYAAEADRRAAATRPFDNTM
jgi:Phospholipase_D-nuclease N-terminal